MELALLAARIVLAAVFATAAAAKLADLAGSRRALADFGVPRQLAGPLGLVLPLVELVAVGLLAAHGSARWGAVVSGVLLLVFSAAISFNLLRGRAPECRCFGQVHSARVSWWTVARNLTLAGLAAAVVSAGAGLSLPAFATAGLGIGIFLASWLVVQRKTNGQAPQSGLPVGTAAPEFRLPALDGHEVTLAALRERGMPVLLVFSDAHCGPCSALAPKVARWQREHAGTLTFAVVERGREVGGPDEHGRVDVLVTDGDELETAYGTQGTPTAVLVGAGGRIASAVAVAGYGIERLVAESTGAPPPPPPAVVTRRQEAPLTRLELLARAGSVIAAAAVLGARDALAGGIPLVAKCKYVRCGNKCCPKTAACRTRRGKKVCICPDGREGCGNKCCKETFLCVKNARGKKVCICPPRTRLCQGRCVPLTDPAHCGGCGNECPPATVCVNGQCIGGDGSGTAPGGVPPCDCPPGKTCCDGACVDLNTDPSHCGRCDQPCPAGQQCCDGVCKDLQADPANCGQCGKRCPAGQACAGGRCGGGGGSGGCPPGLTSCDGRCVDLNADNANCGECGRGCAEGLTCCGEADCVDLRIRPDHCTACYTECNPFLCNCWDSACGGPPEYGCWGTTPPAVPRPRFLGHRR